MTAQPTPQSPPLLPSPLDYPVSDHQRVLSVVQLLALALEQLLALPPLVVLVRQLVELPPLVVLLPQERSGRASSVM
jgi:hypothetical protein